MTSIESFGNSGMLSGRFYFGEMRARPPIIALDIRVRTRKWTIRFLVPSSIRIAETINDRVTVSCWGEGMDAISKVLSMLSGGSWFGSGSCSFTY